jgi:hypothetical protein
MMWITHNILTPETSSCNECRLRSAGHQHLDVDDGLIAPVTTPSCRSFTLQI